MTADTREKKLEFAGNNLADALADLVEQCEFLPEKEVASLNRFLMAWDKEAGNE